ncbi:MAG: hypothetical protein FJ213_00170 [Ignavibacteria bacterium]|nr:hypothetical protein [Ignavibacteria bacterium]
MTFNSCSSKIQLGHNLENVLEWTSFGKIPSRSFYVDENLGNDFSKLWEYSTSAGTSLTSVTVKDSIIFVGNLRGRVHAIELNSGNKIGELDVKAPIYSSIQIRENEIVIATSAKISKSRNIIWYDFVNGKENRNYELHSSVESEIVSIGDYVFLASTDGSVILLNRDKSIIWKKNFPTKFYSKPSSNGNVILIGGIDGSIYCLEFNSGKLQWKFDSKYSIFSGTTIDGEFAYFGNENGDFYKIDLRTGQKIWKLECRSSISALPSIDFKHTFIGTRKGDIFAIDKNDGTVHWQISAGGLVNNSILTFKNKLIVPVLNKNVIVLDKQDGSILKKIEFPGRIKLSPVYIDNKLIFGCDDDLIIAYAVK